MYARIFRELASGGSINRLISIESLGVENTWVCSGT